MRALLLALALAAGCADDGGSDDGGVCPACVDFASHNGCNGPMTCAAGSVPRCLGDQWECIAVIDMTAHD